MHNSDIPDDIIAEIKERASFYEDAELFEHEVQTEIESYRTFLALDFRAAQTVKNIIIDRALNMFESWDDRLSWAENEIESFVELADLKEQDVPHSFINELRQNAANQEEDSFTAQLAYVVSGIWKYRYARRVEPFRDLLIRMEKIVGSSCYNDNIQNYSSWGVWEGEGRSYRYPLSFIKDGKREKRRNFTGESDLDTTTIMTGHYRFGANDLNIFEALLKIAEMIEREYKISLRKSDGNKA